MEHLLLYYIHIHTHFLSLFSTWNQNLRHLLSLNEQTMNWAFQVLCPCYGILFRFFFFLRGGGDEGVSLDYMIYVLRCRLEGRGIRSLSLTSPVCQSYDKGLHCSIIIIIIIPSVPYGEISQYSSPCHCCSLLSVCLISRLCYLVFLFSLLLAS